jgi:hypothetical protein
MAAVAEFYRGPETGCNSTKVVCGGCGKIMAAGRAGGAGCRLAAGPHYGLGLGSSFGRPASGPWLTCTTVTGACRVKFNTASESILICWLRPAA